MPPFHYSAAEGAAMIFRSCPRESQRHVRGIRLAACASLVLSLSLFIPGCAAPGPEDTVHLFVHHYVNNRAMALEYFDLRPDGVERLTPEERSFRTRPMLMEIFRERIREEGAGLMRVNTAHMRTRLVSKGENSAVVHLGGRIEYIYRFDPTRIVELDNLVDVRKADGRWRIHSAVFGVGG
jgi:hypothetical protein